MNKRLKKRARICFGAGKYFDRFIEEFKDVVPKCIVDNYAEGCRMVGTTEIPIISVRQLVDDGIGSEDVIIITTRHYRAILEQLNEIEAFDNVECYLPFEDADEIKRIIDTMCKETKGAGNKFQLLFGNDSEEVVVIAGGKAPNDIMEIAEGAGYHKKTVRSYWEKIEDTDWRFRDRQLSWDKVKDNAQEGGIVLLQNPNWNEEELEIREKEIRQLKKEKGIRIISVVHDVEELRRIDFTDYMKKEAEFMLEISDVLIVHNERMVKFYLDKGIDQRRLVNLKIFDYLCKEKEIPSRAFSTDVIVAGNLEAAKNPHIAEFNRLTGVTFHLFGIGYQSQKGDTNISYHGAVSADELPTMLPDGFGLVWGGDSLDSCTGNAGEYLRFNDPHKLSLYLASDLPVIIWDEAAMAQFVLENDLGITVSSLYQMEEKLAEVTEEDYLRYASNARKIGQRLRNGEYTKAAILEAEKRLQEIQR